MYVYICTVVDAHIEIDAERAENAVSSITFPFDFKSLNLQMGSMSVSVSRQVGGHPGLPITTTVCMLILFSSASGFRIAPVMRSCRPLLALHLEGRFLGAVRITYIHTYIHKHFLA